MAAIKPNQESGIKQIRQSSPDDSALSGRNAAAITPDVMLGISNWDWKGENDTSDKTGAPSKEDWSKIHDNILKRMDFEDSFSEKTFNRLETGFKNLLSGIAQSDSGLNLGGMETAVYKLIEETPDSPDAHVSVFRLNTHSAYIYQHSVKCAILGSFVALNLGYPEEEVKSFSLAMLLHDIGMLSLSESVVNSEDMSGDTLRKLQTHPELGFQILKLIPGMKPLPLIVAASHHVLANGMGYPQGSDFFELPPLAHFAVIIDNFEALLAPRPYRKQLSMYDAVKRLMDRRERYHPGALDRFLKIIGIYPVSTLVELNTGEIGVVTQKNQGSLSQLVVKLVMDPAGRKYPREILVDLSSDTSRVITGVIQ